MCQAERASIFDRFDCWEVCRFLASALQSESDWCAPQQRILLVFVALVWWFSFVPTKALLFQQDLPPCKLFIVLILYGFETTAIAMSFVESYPVLAVTFAFMAVMFVWSHFREWVDFLLSSNLKYKVLDFLGSFIYYGPDIGVEATLKLDDPAPGVLEKRLKGQEYLASKLGNGATLNKRGQDLHSKLVDCRFALAKVCMPLLRELEFSPNKRNFITNVNTDKGMHMVTVDTGDEKTEPLLYCGSDAVHTLGCKDFHAPIQKEINKRMELSNKESHMRFAPIALNTELEKNANAILELTGFDQVRRECECEVK